ncbi:DUF4212 domain-containing protein [Beggiatoa leptomitoformis]|uniref:DUF4212 domain-containing protein n=1 Tax=Beggiatoa leptomitoformis TaxID=288004 RepID=A0A2N9YBG8_9GAMM|nr:sodium/substrate symporter small subunit [Beggiatoa leptomitoformis]ALG66836.1 DUF4212 domain-containing protein [Beggiatoa leptomitoformis]AUI67813.1 DUF4212 domain-containing protein [Beggiatoa leptomitoformis]
MNITEKQTEYWHKNLLWTGILLLIWFIATFIVIFFAKDLNRLTFFNFPVGFYMTAQGSLFLYVLIIWFYAWKMNKLDNQYDVAE